LPVTSQARPHSAAPRTRSCTWALQRRRPGRSRFCPRGYRRAMSYSTLPAVRTKSGFRSKGCAARHRGETGERAGRIVRCWRVGRGGFRGAGWRGGQGGVVAEHPGRPWQSFAMGGGRLGKALPRQLAAHGKASPWAAGGLAKLCRGRPPHTAELWRGRPGRQATGQSFAMAARRTWQSLAWPPAAHGRACHGRPPHTAELGRSRPPHTAELRQGRPPHVTKLCRGRPPHMAELCQGRPPHVAELCRGAPADHGKAFAM